MLLLARFNICSYFTFIPTDYHYEAGLTFYIAILEIIVQLLEECIREERASIRCIFYKDENDESLNNNPEILLSSSSCGVNTIWCHFSIDGNYRKLKKAMVRLDIPSWFAVQCDDPWLNQNNNKLTWEISRLLPVNDNKTDIHIDHREKLYFVKNDSRITSINIKPVIEKARNIDFSTNEFVVKNKG